MNDRGAQETITAELWAELDDVIAAFLEAVTVEDVCDGRIQGTGTTVRNDGSYSAVAE